MLIIKDLRRNGDSPWFEIYLSPGIAADPVNNRNPAFFAFVSLSVSLASEKEAKTGQTGPSKKLGFERKALVFQCFPLESKELMKI
jgi:hypothetical protein